LGNNLNGIDLLSKVNQFERFRWILFSSYVDKYLAFQAEKAGFQACLSKEVPSHVLISLIGNITQDRFVCYPPFAGDDQAKKRIENLHNAIDSLTKRERQVMDILMQGLNSKECAERLHISIFTFETHKKNIFRKLDINSTSELMRIAMDFKFV
jgi:DNA-binding NarL/FixJ family response regulator